MAKQKINKAYVSDLDNFLTDIDKKFPRSQSQLKEISKHEWIFKRRDNGVKEKEDPLKGF